MRNFVLLSATILSLAACNGDKIETSEKIAEVQAQEVASNIVIKGNLTYRERIALRPGLTAKITLSDVSIPDRKAPVLATHQYELRGKQIPLPFELTVDRAGLMPKGRYSVRGTLIGPEGALLWATESAHLINTAKPMQDLGPLNITRTEARRRTQVEFYMCGSVEVETRITDDNMVLIIDGEESNLTKTPAASGAKFREGSGADKVIWIQGSKATLVIGSKTYPECSYLELK